LILLFIYGEPNYTELLIYDGYLDNFDYGQVNKEESCHGRGHSHDS